MACLSTIADVGLQACSAEALEVTESCDESSSSPIKRILAEMFPKNK